MALSSTFEADFGAFVAESKKAELALNGIASSASSASTSTAKLGTASTNTFTTMAGQLRTADQSMAALGVSINPLVNVVGELGQVAGKSALELGALGTASAVAAAAVAGWQLGRWIAEMTGADEFVASLTRHLFGLGDAADEVRANNLEMMNRAIGKGFAGAVTDFVGASAFLQNAAEGNAKAFNKAAAEAEKAAKAQQKLQDELFGYDQIAKAQAYVDALIDVSQVSQMSAAKQAEVNAVLGEALEAYRRLGVVGPESMREIYVATLPLPPMVAGLEAAWNSIGTAVTVNADAIIADLKRMADETRAYEAETQRLVDEWNQVKPPVDATTGAIDQTTAAVGRLAVEMQDLGRVNQTAWEALAAGQALMDAYRSAGVATGAQIGLGGYNFNQQLATGVMPTSTASGQNTLNVNVNNADAQGIATKLVTEMRHQGIRF